VRQAIKHKGRSAAGDGAYDEKRLLAGSDGVGQGGVGGFVRQVFRAGEEAEERAALLADMVANGAAEHGKLELEGIKDGAQGGYALNVELDFTANVRKSAKMRREFHTDHGRP